MPDTASAHSALIDAATHLLYAGVAVAFVAYKARVSGGSTLSEAGFTRRGVIGETVFGFLLGCVLISLVIGIMSLCGIYQLLGLSRHFSPWLPLFSFLCVAVFEETIFRGVIFRLTESRHGSLAALVLSSAVFGLLHLLNVAGEPIPLDQKLLGPVLICLEAGLLLGATYMTTRRLWLPIGIHWAWNFFEGPVYGTQVSGNAAERNALVNASLHGPFWLSGGSFGPEASVICAAVGLALGAGCYGWRRGGGSGEQQDYHRRNR